MKLGAIDTNPVREADAMRIVQQFIAGKRAGGAREGSQGQAPQRAAPGNLPNMPRALKAREDFST